MNVDLEPVAYADKPVLRRMLQLYLYDFTEFSGDDVDQHGEFAYRYLDHYWAPASDDGDRFPFFIRVDGRLAGFALVRLVDGHHEMAEFFVMRRYRRAGVGARAAKDLFSRFPGPWEVQQTAANVPAQSFWQRVIGDFTGGHYAERVDTGRVVQTFTAPV